MVPKTSAQLFSQSLLTGTFAILSIGNAIASEIPTIQVSAVDRQSELLADSTDDSIAKIGGIYPINTLLNPESAPATSNLALTQRKKRIKAKPQIEREGTYNPQINTPPPMPSGLTATQKQIQYKRNDLSVAAQFGNSTSFGIQGKVGVTDNISIRPEFFFSTGGEVENQQTSVRETNRAGEPEIIGRGSNSNYTIKNDSILTTPFTTSGFTITKNIVTNVPIPTGNGFTNIGTGSIFPVDTFLALGTTILKAGVPASNNTYLPAGAIIPAGTLLTPDTYFSQGTIIRAGTVLPAGTEIYGDSTSPVLEFVKVENFTREIPLVLTADYKIISSFTPTLAIGDNPAKKEIKAGTILKAGTVIPVNTPIPVDARTKNNIPVAVPAGLVKGKTTGNSLGVAITYDFKLDPTGKSTAYLGPKIVVSSASGTVNVQGAAAPLTLNTNETKIGVVAGLDYAISDSFTIGANATYNFSRNLTGSASYGGEKLPLQSVGGSSADFGVRLGFQF